MLRGGRGVPPASEASLSCGNGAFMPWLLQERCQPFTSHNGPASSQIWKLVPKRELSSFAPPGLGGKFRPIQNPWRFPMACVWPELPRLPPAVRRARPQDRRTDDPFHRPDREAFAVEDNDGAYVTPTDMLREPMDENKKMMKRMPDVHAICIQMTTWQLPAPSKTSSIRPTAETGSCSRSAAIKTKAATSWAARAGRGLSLSLHSPQKKAGQCPALPVATS